MQQTQQLLPSVKHKLPEPNSILPSELIKSQPARHIRKRVHDVMSISSCDWPLDTIRQSNRDHIAAILGNYYGPNYDITQLIRLQHKIVFLNPMVHPAEHEEDDYYFGSITANASKPRRSMCNPMVRESTYELEFDDKIESGNLYFALQHEPQVYLLANRLDYNTRSFGQWFYFKVRNVAAKSGIFKFYIVNMTKNGAMFGKGLKVSVCRNGVWSKQGTDIEYVPNKFIRKRMQNKYKTLQNSETYHTLSFSLTIGSHQSIYVAYNEPYTYSKLGKKLDQILSNNENVNRSIICRTPLGNRVEIVTITNKTPVKDKKIIFITARAHPVETAGSFVLEGILDELLKPTEPTLVRQLLDNFIIKIVPMINPDGVIVGNSRCNIFGFDVNRQWKDPTRTTAPEIMCLKKTILKYEGRIQMFLDLHGHSTKKNVFAYGCHDVKNPVSSRQFPYILSKFSENDFVYSQCRFSLLSQTKNNGKDGTARVSLWHKLKIPNIFTIQNSYCCAEGSNLHYDSKSYAKIGKNIIISLCTYFSNVIQQRVEQLDQSEYMQIQQNSLQSSQNLALIQRQNILKDLRKNASLINFNIKAASDVSSDSQPQDRVIIKQKQFESPVKLKRNHSNKIYMDSKTEKLNKQRNESEDKQIRKNVTLQPRLQRQEDLLISTENLEQRIKRKQLIPLPKQILIKDKKLQGSASKPLYQRTRQATREDSYPDLDKNKIKIFNKKNAISIIQIGTDDTLQSQRNHELAKAKSAKNISANGQYGIYHRLNMINSKTEKGARSIKTIKNMAPPSQLSEVFSDYLQFRHPVLKMKKNVSVKNANRLQDFISKINAMQATKGVMPNGKAKKQDYQY